MNYKSMAAGYAIHWKENQQLAPLQRVNGCGFNGRIYGTHTHSHSQTTALLNTSHHLRSECEVKLIWVEEECMSVQRRRHRCRCACVCVCVHMHELIMTMCVYFECVLTHFSDILYALSGGGWPVLALAAVIGIMSVSLLSVIINTV